MTYNGWKNYETWRVNLEMFDCYEPEEKVDADWVENEINEFVENNCDNIILQGWISGFIEEVDYQEIADALNERLN